jgi:hypothetical protein
MVAKKAAGRAFCQANPYTMLQYRQLPPVLNLLLLVRKDMAQWLDVSTAAGWADAMAWFFVRAVPEYGLYGAIDRRTLDGLNAPSRALLHSAGQDEAAAQDALAGLSVLMGLTWRHRADVQKVFDIANPTGRAQFIVWFLSHGVPEHQLQSLMSDEWRTKLLSPSPFTSVADLPYLGHLAWLARPDLQAAFDLTTPEGQQSLRAWTEHELNTGPHWQWLRQSASAFRPSTQRSSAALAHKSGCRARCEPDWFCPRRIGHW